jgi:hypothetical protein
MKTKRKKVEFPTKLVDAWEKKMGHRIYNKWYLELWWALLEKLYLLKLRFNQDKIKDETLEDKLRTDGYIERSRE